MSNEAEVEMRYEEARNGVAVGARLPIDANSRRGE